ncbi:MAG: hypothetical protein ACJ0GX_11765 [Parasynechococcus sp.]|uniref:hypothetical protein n=1 Tax=Parasynechococcus sp. TaxID=3101203 RepID=UPI003884C3AE
MVRHVPLDLDIDNLLEGSKSDLGVDLDDLYPVVVTHEQLGALRSLVYDYGYGPNAFPWHKKKADKNYLSRKPTKLYLISIDAGTLTGQKKCLVWKIGITSKEVVGSSTSRYSGQLAKYIEVLREVEYEDGSIAFMKEQVFMQLANREKSRSLGTRVDWGKLSDGDRSRLGLSEIVLTGRPKSLAINLFDQINI